MEVAAKTCDNPIPHHYIVTVRQNNRASAAAHSGASTRQDMGTGSATIIQDWARKYGTNGGTPGRRLSMGAFTLMASLKNAPVAMVDADDEALDIILHDEEVESIYQDCVVGMIDDEVGELGTAAPPADDGQAPGRRLNQQANPTWGLDRIDAAGLDGTYEYKSASGRNVKVYVLDQPVANLVDFGGRVENGWSAESTDHNWMANGIVPEGQTCGNHGSHVAGTVGSATYGVAKGVTIVPIQVLGCGVNAAGNCVNGCRGTGSYSGVIAGVDEATTRKVASGEPGIITMSLDGPAYAPLDEAVKRAAEAGAHVFVAGGNSGPAKSSTRSPARAGGPGSDVVTVGAIDRNNKFANCQHGSRNCYKYGETLDLLAPGVAVESWSNGGNVLTYSGTSMATPHVSGVAALLLQAKPWLTPAQAKEELLAAASTPQIDYTGLPNNHGTTNKVLRIPPSVLFTPVLRVGGKPAYASRTVGDYVLDTSEPYYLGKPIYSRTDQHGLKWRLYDRSDASPYGWVLDFNKADSTWGGTVNYALSSHSKPVWEAAWNNRDQMEVNLPVVCVTGSPAYDADTRGEYEWKSPETSVYNSAPIWTRRSGWNPSAKWSIYNRRNGAYSMNGWVLDFNAASTDWSGTVNYAWNSHTKNVWDDETKWNNDDKMQIGPCPPSETTSHRLLSTAAMESSTTAAEELHESEEPPSGSAEQLHESEEPSSAAGGSLHEAPMIELSAVTAPEDEK